MLSTAFIQSVLFEKMKKIKFRISILNYDVILVPKKTKFLEVGKSRTGFF